MGLGPNGAVHLYPVIRGQRPHLQGWALPDFAFTVVELEDVYGNSYIDTVKNLVSQYEISPKTIFSLILGKKKLVRGLYVKGQSVVFAPQSPYKAKKFSFRTPNGKVLQANTIVGLARQTGMQQRSAFNKMINGKWAKSRGYSVENIEFVKRKVLCQKGEQPEVIQIGFQ